MADLLSHALFAFAVFTALGWIVSWLDHRWVVVGMVGSILPDLIGSIWSLTILSLSSGLECRLAGM